jgi:uncharacterized protein YybS (DUF2232 family)
MKASTSVALISLGKATAATVIVGVCLGIFPLAPVVLVPVLVLPLAHAVARWGLLQGVAVAVVSGGLIYVAAGLGLALLAFLLVGCAGTAAGLVIRQRRALGPGLGVTAAAVLLAFVAWGAILWLAFGVSLGELNESALASIESTAELYRGLGVSQATLDTVSDQLRRLVEILPYLAPGFLGMSAVLIAACTLGLAALILPKVKHRVTVAMSLVTFRMHWAAAYASIAGLAMVVVSRSGGDWGAFLLYAGIDILLVSQTLFFIQGFAVVRWFVVTRQLGSGPRAALYGAAVLGQAVLQLTGLLGLLDTWIDYRRRFSLKSPGTGPLR